MLTNVLQTMHQWNNLTDKLCRIIFVLLPAKAATIEGKVLGDYGVPEKFKVED